MIPRNRVEYLARIDGLSNELLRLSLHCKQFFSPLEAKSLQSALRPLVQWCCAMHNDKED